jgi:uncharacterized protein (TIGR03435 family)
MTALPSPRVIPALVLFCALTSSAQTHASGSAPSFEVISIRMASPQIETEITHGIRQFATCTYPSSRFFMHNVPLTLAIAMAYGMDIHNSPDWADTHFYDIDANVEGDKQLTLDEMRPLVKTLLEQRFHLEAHIETHDVSGYKLVVGKNGAKLQPGKDDSRPKGLSKSFNAQFTSTQFDGWSIPVATFAHILSGAAGAPVVDATGIQGKYDIHLRFADPNDPASAIPSVFTAVQEQLGLKLEPSKVPVTYAVVDHVDRVPTDN